MANTIKLKNSGTSTNVPSSLEHGELAINYADGKIFYKDSTNTVVHVKDVAISDEAPSSPVEGDMWFESDTADFHIYYDGAWVDVGGSSVANISIGSSPPTSTPVNGDLWFDSDTAKTYIYYNDGTSSQWIEVGAVSAAASGTDGSIQFASGGTFSSDASNLVWDDTNNRLSIGTTTPTASLTVTSGTDDAKVKIDSNGGSVGIIDATANTNDATGRWLSINPSGGNVGIGTTTPTAKLDVDGETQASYVTLDRGGISLSQPAIDVEANGVGAGDFNYFFRAWNDTGAKAVMFVNGSTRSADGGANTMTIRNDGGDSRFGSGSYLTTVIGNNVHLSGNVGIGTTTPSSKVDVYTDVAAGVPYPLTLSAKNSSGTKKDYVRVGFGIEQGAAGIEAGGFRVQTLRNGAITNAVDFTGATGAQTWNFYTEGVSRMAIDTSGNVGIGTTGPQTSLHVKRGTGITAANYSGEFAALIYHASNASTKHGLLVTNQWIADASTLIEAGNIYATNAAYTKMFYVNGVGRSYNQYGTWGTISDQTLKTDIVDAGNQLDDILGLRFVNYKFIKDVERDPETAPRLFGLVAQEVEQVSPGLVTEDGEGIKTVNTSVLSMKAVKAMQEMHAIIESQQTVISELTARIEALEGG